jgi:hypothetical protein
MDIDQEGLSEEEEKESRKYYEDAQVNLAMRDSHRIDLAIGAYRKDLDLRYKIQGKGKRIHKGKPYYNLGLCFLFEEKWDLNQAVYNLLLAYIEDVVSAKDSPDTAESLGAARLLRHDLRFDPKVISKIRMHLATFSQEVRDPRDVLESVMKDQSITETSLGLLCTRKIVVPRKVPLGAPTNVNWPKRVFVGGNYSANFGSLLKIKQILLRKGFEPVVADDYVHSGEQSNRDFCLMLLHTCRYAIFDMTTAGGQLIEIDRARDYGIREPLVIFNASSLSRVQPLTSGTSMLEYEMAPYRDPETDLEQLVENYLKQNR